MNFRLHFWSMQVLISRLCGLLTILFPVSAKALLNIHLLYMLSKVQINVTGQGLHEDEAMITQYQCKRVNLT